MLFGLLFFMPFFGLAVGAVLGGLAGRFSDYGIDDDFIKSVRDQVTEGTSALFLLSVTGSAAVDRLQDELKGKMGSLIKSNLTNEQEAKLNEAFGEQQKAWRIGPRTLPPPTGGSDELRNAIADIPQPDPATMQIEPQSEAEWPRGNRGSQCLLFDPDPDRSPTCGTPVRLSAWRCLRAQRRRSGFS
jgi:hypothetical protein